MGGGGVMADNGMPKLGRRAVLGAAMGGAAAAAAAALATPSAVLGANGDPVKLGEDNTATAMTAVLATGAHAFYAKTDAGDALRGWSDGAGSSGVFGYATNPASFGVYGKNGGRGVAALGTYGAALWASTNGFSAPLALKIEGKAQFSRSGRITIAKGKRSATLPVVAAGTTFGIATVQQLRTDLYVQSVVRSGSSLRVYLNRAAPSATYVAWMAFERP
jgi:hypothetical protein